MRFSHIKLSKDLKWNETTRLNELVIESPLFLRKILRDLAVQDDSSEICFTKNGEAMNFTKEIDVIYNPLHLDFNNRKAMTTLLKMLVKTSVSEDFYMETNEFKTRIVKYLNKIVDSENFIFEVDTGEFAIDNIAKAVNLHVIDDEDDFVELLTDYMTMMAELAGIKLFIFLNLRTILLNNELERLIENLKNHELNMFLIEGRQLEKIQDVNSGRIIVDADLCEI